MDEVPQDIFAEAEQVKSNLLPNKSKDQYEKEYQLFNTWKKSKNVSIVNEDVLLVYFSQKVI